MFSLIPGSARSDEMQSRSGGRGDASSSIIASCPHDSDDVQIAERHNGGRHDQYVTGQEREVDFALPLGRVAVRPTAEYLAPTVGTAAVRRLDEDEELRQGEHESHRHALLTYLLTYLLT